jgi:hypothetical protein
MNLDKIGVSYDKGQNNEKRVCVKFGRCGLCRIRVQVQIKNTTKGKRVAKRMSLSKLWDRYTTYGYKQFHTRDESNQYAKNQTISCEDRGVNCGRIESNRYKKNLNRVSKMWHKNNNKHRHTNNNTKTMSYLCDKFFSKFGLSGEFIRKLTDDEKHRKKCQIQSSVRKGAVDYENRKYSKRCVSRIGDKSGGVGKNFRCRFIYNFRMEQRENPKNGTNGIGTYARKQTTKRNTSKNQRNLHNNSRNRINLSVLFIKTDKTLDNFQITGYNTLNNSKNRSVL